MKIPAWRRTVRGIAPLLLLLSVASCGEAPEKGGTGVGPVSGFAPGVGNEAVIVNGVTYNVDNATLVDAHGRGLDNLAAGMVVKVTASRIDDNPKSPTGVATVVELLRLADGPVDNNSVSFDNNSFRVMGQTVFVGLTTVFDNVSDLSGIDNMVRQGMLPEIEIHGSPDDTGSLRASFVHLWSDNVVEGREIRMRGTVRNLDGTDNTFAIGPLLQKVEYGAVASVPSGLESGVFVEVRGTYRGSDNTVVATALRLEDPASGQKSGDLAKAEGYVNRLLADSGTTKRFEWIGPDGLQEVTWTTVATTFREGAASDIAPGARVLAEGSRKKDNTLSAKRIWLRKPCNIRIESTVTGKTSSAITVLGRTVSVNLLTLYRDGTGTFPGAFGLGEIRVNDTVRVEAYLDTAQIPERIVASRVELRERNPVPYDRHVLHAVVERKNVPSTGSLRILGVDVSTAAATTEFLRVDGTPFPGTGVVRQTNFLAAVTEGVTVVAARGTYFASTMTAGEVKIEAKSTK